MQYQVSSPYIELLQSKKRASGQKYDNKNHKGNSKSNIESGFGNSSQKRPSKSSSVEKVIQNRFTQQINLKNTLKDTRTRTQNTDEKLHQSLFVQAGRQDYLRHKPSKSLYYDPVKSKEQQSTFKKWAQMFKPTTHKKKKRKQNSISKSKNLNISDSQFLTNFEKLNITDIDSLISLIDRCVFQANQYINTLSKKVQELKQQLIYSKNSSMQLLSQMKKLTQDLGQKDKIIREQQLQIRQLKIFTGKIGMGRDSFTRTSEHPFEKDKLLQTIAKLSEENERLKEEVIHFKNQKNHKNKQPSKEIYGEIHSKIDILNISIDSKKNPIPQSPFNSKHDGKKGKFIKTKLK